MAQCGVTQHSSYAELQSTPAVVDSKPQRGLSRQSSFVEIKARPSVQEAKTYCGLTRKNSFAEIHVMPVVQGAKPHCGVVRQSFAKQESFVIVQGGVDVLQRPPVSMPRANGVRALVSDIEKRLAKQDGDFGLGRMSGGACEMQQHLQCSAPAQAKHRAPTVVQMGDVLFVEGNGRVAQIGTSGGLMGHVLVALGPLTALDVASVEELVAVCPHLDGACMWRVETLESCRQRAGLHQAEMILRVEPATGRMLLVAELANNSMTILSDESVEIFQSPPKVRSQLDGRIVSEVVNEMKECEQNWSFRTAARAFFTSAPVRAATDRTHLLDELQRCWDVAPICTSIVIVFWQRCLCRIAIATGQPQIEMILRYMPLKADRGLPGELVRAMRRCRWITVKRFCGQ